MGHSKIMLVNSTCFPRLTRQAEVKEGTQGPLEASEVERAARWAIAIHQQYEAPQLHFVMQLP